MCLVKDLYLILFRILCFSLFDCIIMNQGLVIISINYRASFRDKQECVLLITVTVLQNCEIHSGSVLALQTSFVAVYPAMCFKSFMLMYPLHISGLYICLYCRHAIRQNLDCCPFGFCFCFKLSARKKGLIHVPTRFAKTIVLHRELQKVKAFVNCWKESFQIHTSSVPFSGANLLGPPWIFP